MASRLALLAVVGDYEGPWMRANGAESHALVSGLGEGDSVSLVCDETSKSMSKEGHLPFPKPHPTRYRIHKRGNAGPPTTVRIVSDASCS